MSTTLGGLVSEVEGPHPANSHDPEITWRHGVTWQIKNNIISTSPKVMTANFGNVEIYNKRPSSISLLRLWARDQGDHVTDNKRHISNSAIPMAKKLRIVLVLMRAYYLQTHITCWSRSHMTNKKRYRFISAWPVAIKHDRRVAWKSGV